MKTFVELEEEYASEAIWLPDNEKVTGIIQLCRDKSAINLVSKDFFHFDTDENGWLSLRLSGPKGTEMLAHNLLFQGTGQMHGKELQTVHSAQTFPNILVTDTRGLADNNRVDSVSFQLTGWNSIFYYRYAEHLDTFDLSSDNKRMLRNLRYGDDEEDDIFDPHDIYVCSWPSEIIEFKVKDRTYTIDLVGKGSLFDWHGISLTLDHVATIKFSEAVSIDTAIDRIYEWRRFFNQLVMVPLDFKSVAFSKGEGTDRKVAPVYMPYAVKERDPRKGHYGVHPAYVPLNAWSDRKRLAEAMEAWLSRDEFVRGFRVRLDRVLRNINEEVDQSDLNDLCAAIDGHPDLQNKSKIDQEKIERMAEAAFAAAQGLSDDITVERIQGLLGLLQSRSLKRKLEILSSESLGNSFSDTAPAVIDLAVRIRRDAAHRGILEEQIHPLVRPVVEALSSMCVAFDLGAAGVPIRGQEHGTSGRWMSRFRDAEMVIRSR